MSWIPDSIRQGWDRLTDSLNDLGNALVNGGSIPEGFASGNDLGQSRYDFNYKVFPTDIGMDHVGHYMIININVPTKGLKLPTNNGLALGEPAGRFGQFFDTNGITSVSKVDTLRYRTGGGAGTSRPAVSVPRQTRRIRQSIALFMPQGLQWYQRHGWEDISMTEFAGKVGVGLLNIGNTRVGGALGGLLSSATQGGTIQGGAAITGNPINPSVEVIFSTTLLREFTFDFLFAPRNQEESIAAKEIMTQIRFHGAPEINPSTKGATWIPPAEFDITFFKHGVENREIARINTCVLVDIEIDYAPSGIYSTFRNGHPVQMRMRCTFREVEPIHKERVAQGF